MIYDFLYQLFSYFNLALAVALAFVLGLVSFMQGISQTIGNFSGVVAVPATAVIVDRFGWNAVFYVLAVELIAAALLYHYYCATSIVVEKPALSTTT